MKSDLARMRESSIRSLTDLSSRLNAVNLSQGFPDEDAPEEIKQFAIEAVARGHNQYAPPRGALALRAALSEKLQRFNHMTIDPEREIAITCGGTEGMMMCFEALLNRGDEVIAFTPIYENFLFHAVATGVALKTVELTEPDFALTRQHLLDALTPQTAAILICNPCNPTGKVLCTEELTMIAAIAAERNLLIFADETYEHFVWNGQAHISIGALPEARDRTVTVASLGKSYSVTGWRVGYVAGAAEHINRISTLRDFHTITAPHPLQVALASAARLPETFYERLRSQYWERKLLLSSALHQAGFQFFEPGGSYFLWCSYQDLSGDADIEFCRRLIAEGGVAAVPGSVFYPPSEVPRYRLRLTFSKSLRTLQEATDRILQFR